MDEKYEELAALNALSMLESDEKRGLTGTCLANKELRDLVADLEITASQLACLIAPVEPPADMKRRIRAKIRSRGGQRLHLSPAALISAAGWALVLVLTGIVLWLWQDRSQLSSQLTAVSQAIAVRPEPTTTEAPKAEVKEAPAAPAINIEAELKKLRDDFAKKQAAQAAEIESLSKRETEAQAKITQLTAEAAAQKQREAEAKFQITTQQTTVWEYRRGIMTVIWDDVRRQGVLILDKLPKVEAGKDYQLWVTDPQKPEPISAGIVELDKAGVARIQFKPAEEVGPEVKFSLSVEVKGGAPKREGELIFSGQ